MNKTLFQSISALLALMLILTLTPITSIADSAETRLAYDRVEGGLRLSSAVGASKLTVPAEVQGHPVTEIGPEAFVQSPNLEAIAIPASILKIDRSAFDMSSELRQIDVSPDNPNFTGNGGGLYSKDGKTLIMLGQGVTGDIEMPETLERVQTGAFSQCQSLTSVKFNEGLTELGEDSFMMCSGLSQIELPVSLQTLPESSPFRFCYSLNIKVAPDNPTFETKDGALYTKGGEKLIAYPGARGEVKLPEGTAIIGKGAFANTDGLNAIILPDSLKKIESSAFLDCTNLTRLVIPSGVTNIAAGAIDGCDHLELLKIPESVTDIGNMDIMQGSSMIVECVQGSAGDAFAQLNALQTRYIEPAATVEPANQDGDKTVVNVINDDPTDAPTTDPTPAPTEGSESTPTPTPSLPPLPSPDAGEADETDDLSTSKYNSPYAQILFELDNLLINETYDYLLAGNTIERGNKKTELRGLQQLLNMVGENLTVDGSIGEKTINALTKVQKAFALDESTVVKQKNYEQLILTTYMAVDPQGARALLDLAYGDQIDYIGAATELLKGNHAAAYQEFIALSGYRDSRQKAESCLEPWPGNGQLYRNSEYEGSAVRLIVKTSRSEDEATYVKIYSGQDLVSTLFIAGSNSTSISLPKGVYSIKTGTGKNWFGPNDAFGQGPDSYYEQLTFADNATTADFKTGRQYTLTIGNAVQGNVGSNQVNSDSF